MCSHERWYTISGMARKINPQPHTRSFIISLAAFFVTCLSIGTVFYHLVERFSFIDSFYLTAMTLTTVGYGDLAPLTAAGKIFTSIFAFLGVATFLGFASALFANALYRFDKQQ